jgi:hypothetical protein
MKKEKRTPIVESKDFDRGEIIGKRITLKDQRFFNKEGFLDYGDMEVFVDDIVSYDSDKGKLCLCLRVAGKRSKIQKWMYLIDLVA